MVKLELLFSVLFDFFELNGQIVFGHLSFTNEFEIFELLLEI